MGQGTNLNGSQLCGKTDVALVGEVLVARHCRAGEESLDSNCFLHYTHSAPPPPWHLHETGKQGSLRVAPWCSWEEWVQQAQSLGLETCLLPQPCLQ